MQGIHSHSCNSGWTENTCSKALQQRRSLPTPPAATPDVLLVLPAVQVPRDTYETRVREKRGCLNKKILRKKSNRSGATPPEDSELPEATDPIPTPSHSWKQQGSSHNPSESRREEVLQGAQWGMTLISLMSTWGWARVWVGPRSTQ